MWRLIFEHKWVIPVHTGMQIGPRTRTILRLALVLPALFWAVLVLIYGDVPWLLLIGGITACGVWRVPGKILRWGIGIAGCGVVAAHMTGWKIYGSPVEIDNRPLLETPHEVEALAAPNIIIAKDGTRLEVKDVVFGRDLLAMRMVDFQELLDRHPDSGPVRVQADAGSPSGVVLEWHTEYPCGAPYAPRFFPGSLAAWSRRDFGAHLVHFGLARSVGEPTKTPPRT